MRSALLEPTYSSQIRHAYTTTGSGNYDLSVAFVEHALAALRPGGIASYVLTQKFMSAKYGRAICQDLSAKARLLNIEDFQDYQLFPGRTTYTCVLTFAKKDPAARFTVTRFPQGVEGRRDPGSGETESLPTERLSSHPWEFATGTTHSILRLMRSDRHPLLRDVFPEILQGLRTGSNQAFVLRTNAVHGIESDLLRVFVTGEQIRRGLVETDALRLLFPYGRSALGALRLHPHEEMERRWPNAWSYLLGKREILEERSLADGVTWYEYSRNQNLDLVEQPKILVREMMPRAEFAADYDGTVAFVSGYGLHARGMTQEAMQLWVGVLCTPTMEFLLRHTGTQLRSGWFRLLKHHLTRVRLPKLEGEPLSRALEHAEAFQADPTRSESLSRLDDIVAAAFNLSDKARLEIERYLADCHDRSLSKRVREGTQEQVKETRYQPVRLRQYKPLHRDRPDLRAVVTAKPAKAAPVHRWFRCTQGFSGALVEHLLQEFSPADDEVILDPFVGSGTTPLECRKHGFPSMGVDVSPLMTWICKAKLRPWRHKELRHLADSLALPEASSSPHKPDSSVVFDSYLQKAYSPEVLRQIWTLADHFRTVNLPPRHRIFLQTVLLSILEEISQIRKHGSHYRYLLRSENAGLQKLNIQIFNPKADIRPLFLNRMAEMIDDVESSEFARPLASARIILGDARNLDIPNESISLVITSPPYLNRNNYIAQQKAEMAVLGLVETHQAYRHLVQSTMRSHVECKYDSKPTSRMPEVRKIIEAIDLTDGNNPRIPHMIGGYFDDLDDCLRELFRVMKPAARAAFVVGCTRWGGVVVPVDHLLLRLAEQRGFKAERVWVTRLKGNSPQQMRRYGRIPVRESVVIFRK